MALACKNLGIAHPTGYPLYTLLGRLASLFLYGELIDRMNLLSLIFASLATGFLFLSIREFVSIMKTEDRRRDFIAFSTALFASLTPIWWAQGTTNEVYSLNLLLITISLWTFFKYLNVKNIKCLVFSSYALGLSLTNHLSAIYILPAFALIIIYLWKKKKIKGNILIYSGIFFLFPLSIYLFLPMRARFSPFLNWGGVDDWYFLYKHISGWQYRIWMFSDFSLSVLIDKIVSAVSLMYKQFNWFGAVLCVAGIIISLTRKVHLSIFGLLIIILNFLYASNYDIIDIESYYLPMIIMLSIYMAAGTVYLVLTVSRAFKDSVIVRYIILFGIILLPVSNFIDNYFVSDRSGRTFARQSVHDMIDSMEPGGLAFVENWDFYSPWLYYHFEDSLRPDIVLLDKELMRRSWYMDFIKRVHPEIYQNSSGAIEDFLREVEPFERSQPFDAAVIDKAYYNMLHTITLKELRNRPVYTNILVDKKYTGILPLAPTGILFRIEETDGFIESTRFEFNKALWGNRFIYRDRRIAVILSYYRNAFSSREKYCRFFNNEAEADYYKKKTAEVSAVMTEITSKK
ncbi:MAG: DUF2723 domain-containing protein [Candidatus Zixiibacteriota bacterium]|nr:MAG: DUF2723 domain-containing protein [candidate division Zixibacteria bacterium]